MYGYQYILGKTIYYYTQSGTAAGGGTPAKRPIKFLLITFFAFEASFIGITIIRNIEVANDEKKYSLLGLQYGYN